ncbi:hypothetical protein DFJ73DRAFT_960076 [Zopfochytrium polystomum]|nr:hypothetical protein DFJ73DRAFT_960076 [Zopfochytrium polystomum]
MAQTAAAASNGSTNTFASLVDAMKTSHKRPPREKSVLKFAHRKRLVHMALATASTAAADADAVCPATRTGHAVADRSPAWRRRSSTNPLSRRRSWGSACSATGWRKWGSASRRSDLGQQQARPGSRILADPDPLALNIVQAGRHERRAEEGDAALKREGSWGVRPYAVMSQTLGSAIMASMPTCSEPIHASVDPSATPSDTRRSWKSPPNHPRILRAVWWWWLPSPNDMAWNADSNDNDDEDASQTVLSWLVLCVVDGGGGGGDGNDGGNGDEEAVVLAAAAAAAAAWSGIWRLWRQKDDE